MALWRDRFWHAAFKADAGYDRARRALRRRLGVARPLEIVPYRGFGTRAGACIKARIQEDRGAPEPRSQRSLLGSVVASYKRYATVEIPHAEVRVRWGDRTWDARSDEEGFIDLWVTPPSDCQAGWNAVTLELQRPNDDQPLPTTRAQVLMVEPDAELGVISDIDDTVIVTGVTSKLRRAQALFLSEHRMRLPFAGVREFYRGLAAGPSGESENPLFYVSSSPWNLYEHLEHFMEVHELPAGPILLRDWGLSRTGFAPGGGHGHKLEKIRTVLDALPELPFVLMGDSGQQDAEHYLTIAREYGARIPFVYIRSAHRRRRRDAELEELQAAYRASETEMVLVHDTVEAARHAVERGLIAPGEVAAVERDRAGEPPAPRFDADQRG